MRARVVAAAVVVALVALGAGCGDDDGGDGLGGAGQPPLDGAAAAGREVAGDRGCTSCHTASGDDRSGPTWKGLWGSQVELEDGTTVTADRDYVVRAIREPDAEVVDGYAPIMPDVDLSDAEVDELVAYIEALG